MTNQYNKDGKKEGLWVKTYDNGRIQEEKNYEFQRIIKCAKCR